jgi:hypothetical protein
VSTSDGSGSFACPPYPTRCSNRYVPVRIEALDAGVHIDCEKQF